MQRILENPAAASHHWRKKVYACSTSNRFDERSGNKIAQVVRTLTGYNAVRNDVARYCSLSYAFLMIFAICIFFYRDSNFCSLHAKILHGISRFTYSYLFVSPICITNNKTYMIRCLNYIG